MKREPQTNDIVQLNVSLPIKGHNGRTLRNLINMIYSMEDLMNKAIGTRFHVDGRLIDWLDWYSGTDKLDVFFNAVESCEAEFGKSTDGLEVRRDRITFSFKETSDPGLLKTYVAFCAMMNKYALKEPYVSGLALKTGNEKLDMRNFLLKIGMTGPNYEMERNVLTFLLPGFIERV